MATKWLAASRRSAACTRPTAVLRRRGRSQRPFDWFSRQFMAQLTAQVISYDDEFKQQIARLVRACGVPVGIVEGRSAEGIGPDLVVVDIRSDASSGMAAIERLRASSASLAIFAIA